MSGIDVRRAVCLAVVVGASAWFVACDGKSSPTAPGAGQASTTRLGATLTITGKTSIDHPGETTQLTAVLTAADGTRRDVTAEAQWTTRGVPRPYPYATDDVLALVSPGVFRALRYGGDSVTATYKAESNYVAGAYVRVAPDGSHLLSGRVVTFEYGALPAARIEARSASGTVSAVTSGDGAFWIPALGDTILRVDKEGFPTYTRAQAVNADTVMDIWVPRAGAGSATGSYTLTFTAAPSCSTTPRIYDVDIEEWQGRLNVFAQGQQFVSFAGPPGFTGTRTANTVTFTISDNIFEQLCFVDGLLGYSGLATGTITERGIVATFDGRIGTCQAADHRMELVRVQTAR